MWRLKPTHSLNLGLEGVGRAIVLVETVDPCPSYCAVYHRPAIPNSSTLFFIEDFDALGAQGGGAAAGPAYFQDLALEGS